MGEAASTTRMAIFRPCRIQTMQSRITASTNNPAEIIPAWDPFVTPKPLLAWHVFLRLFDPVALFVHIAHNLVLGGTFVYEPSY